MNISVCVPLASTLLVLLKTVSATEEYRVNLNSFLLTMQIVLIGKFFWFYDDRSMNHQRDNT